MESIVPAVAAAKVDELRASVVRGMPLPWAVLHAANEVALVCSSLSRSSSASISLSPSLWCVCACFSVCLLSPRWA